MKFAALTAEAGLTAQPPSRHRGSAFGDLNGDGRLDVVVSALSAPAEIWINQSPGNSHWIEFKLQGTKSNRDGIGARIKVVTKSGAQYNHVTTAAATRRRARARCTLAWVRTPRRTWWRFAGPLASCRP